MTFRVLSTNHTSFTVSSLDRTVAFFTECLPGTDNVNSPSVSIDVPPRRSCFCTVQRDPKPSSVTPAPKISGIG